jgi:hypothetical protein
MATIWPYRREECTDIPKLVFNPQTKVDFDGENKIIIIDQDRNLTEFSLSVPLLKKVSNYFGKNSENRKIDYCLVLTNKETRSRVMQKMNQKGSSITTQKSIKIGHLRGKVELNIYAVLANDVTLSSDSFASPANKGTILATWPQSLIYLDSPPDRKGDEFPTEWVAFSKMESTKKYPKAIHYVDLEEPKVFINDDLPIELKNILQGNEGGYIKALREAYLSPVAVDITEQLARHALIDAQGTGGLENLEGSYSKLIETICTLLTGIDDQQEALSELNIIVTDKDTSRFNNIIASTLPLACQQLKDVSSKLNNHAIQKERNS